MSKITVDGTKFSSLFFLKRRRERCFRRRKAALLETDGGAFVFGTKQNTNRRGRRPLQCALFFFSRLAEGKRKREKDTRRDDERQQRAPHRDDDRCGGRANATFNRIHFWIFLSLIEWSCLRRARKEARTSTRTTSYQQRQQR